MEEARTTGTPALESEPRETPMGQVWLIVIGTMLVSSAIMFGWHIVAMRTAAQEDRQKVDVIRVRIGKLEEYKSILTSGGKETAEDFLKSNSAQIQ